jgi:hypothetical protein
MRASSLVAWVVLCLLACDGPRADFSSDETDSSESDEHSGGDSGSESPTVTGTVPSSSATATGPDATGTGTVPTAATDDSVPPADDATPDDATADDSALDDSATDDSATDDSATDDSATDDSATDDVATDDSATDDSATDDVATDDSALDDTSADDMAADDTATDDVATDDSTTDDSTSDDSATDETASDDSTSDDAATDEAAEPDASTPCTGGGCAPLSQGASCDDDDECSSGTCQDGFCCDSACDGNCESCAVPGSLGTCRPVTTPRSSCGGIGVCAGYCDGTAQNRDACVFPGSSTSCGSAASCSDGEFTSAATCNSAGSCAERTTMSCMFGCRSDGEIGCASTCPANQDLCDGSCVDTESDPDNCGSSCQECGGATAICASGECVECEVTADCSGTGVACTNEGACECGTGYHACGASRSPCYSDTDVAHCGGGCTDCRQANANAACGVGNACANTCTNSAFTLSCAAVGGKPNCSQWDFESGSAEGWQLVALDASANASSAPLATSTFDSTSGSASLAIPFNNSQDDARFIEIRVQLCAGGNVLDLSDKNLHWSFRMDPPQSGGYNFLQVYDAPNFGGGGGLFDFNTDSDGEWDNFDYTLSNYPVFEQVAGIGFHLQATENYVGVFYIDDIRIY